VNGPPALFSKARPQTCSALLRNQPIKQKPGDIAGYGAERLRNNPELEWARWVGEALQGLPREAAVGLDVRSRVHRYRLGRARLIAVERNINYQMSEALKQAGGNQNLEKAVDTHLTLSEPAHVYDLRTGSYLGHVAHLHFGLDPWRPSLFALLEERVTDGALMESLR